MKDKAMDFMIIAVLILSSMFISTIEFTELNDKIDKLENKEVIYLLPKDAECAVKMMIFRDKDGKLMKPVARQTCNWRID